MKLKEWIDDPKFTKKAIKAAMLLITFAVLLIYVVFHLEQAGSILNALFSLFSPFLMGIAVAFVLNVLLKLFEERIFGFLKRKNSKIWQRCGRGVCVLLSFIVVFLIVGGIIFFVVPELANSIQILTAAIPGYVNSFTKWLNGVLTKFDLTQLKEAVMQIDWSSLLTQASQVTTDVVGSVANATVGVASGIFTFVMSLIFSVYMLYSKEKLIRNLKRVLPPGQTGAAGDLHRQPCQQYLFWVCHRAGDGSADPRLPVLFGHEYHPPSLCVINQCDRLPHQLNPHFGCLHRWGGRRVYSADYQPVGLPVVLNLPGHPPTGGREPDLSPRGGDFHRASGHLGTAGYSGLWQSMGDYRHFGGRPALLRPLHAFAHSHA